jgi:flagellar basal body-associated protein FliL
MASQREPDRRREPAEGSITRRYVLTAIIALTVVFLLAAVVGPLLMASGDADPRPFAAALTPIYYVLALLLGVAWMVWFVYLRKPR